MSFSPDKDIPDLSGKIILVTGGNSGLGKETVLQLAKHNPRKLFLGARNKAKAEEAMTEIKRIVPNANISFLEINLSSFSSIQRASETLLQQCDRLDILVNNAGLMGVEPSLTEDGYEMQFGSNHMGPALLTKLLLPLLERTSRLPESDVRIVQVSSDAHQFAPKEGILFSHLKDLSADLPGRTRYGQSKLANLYFIKSLAKRYPSIKCVSLHPGLVGTGILNNTQKSYAYISWLIAILKKVVMVDVQTGALGQLWAATGPRAELKDGAYYVPLKKEIKGNKQVDNMALAEELWDWTEKEFKKHGL